MDLTSSVEIKRSSLYSISLFHHFHSHIHYLQFSITMPCLALGKGLFPAIKTWKRITTKLLQKLHPCKFIKISKIRRANATRYKAPPFMYYPSLPSKKNRRRCRAKDRCQLFGTSKALHRPKHQYRFKKQSLQAPPPVFIDELFWVHPTEVEESLPSSSVSGGPKGKAETVARSSVVGPSNGLLRGIDARAEEFINRFRAELENQEIVAHVL